LAAPAHKEKSGSKTLNAPPNSRSFARPDAGSLETARRRVSASDVTCARPRSPVGPTASGSRYDSFISTCSRNLGGRSYAVAASSK